MMRATAQGVEPIRGGLSEGDGYYTSGEGLETAVETSPEDRLVDAVQIQVTHRKWGGS